MKSEEFAFWLNGALELNPEMLEKGMTPTQVKIIKDHLDLVFNKVTPDRFEKEKEELIDFDLINNQGLNIPLCSPGDDKLFCQSYAEGKGNSDFTFIC